MKLVVAFLLVLCCAGAAAHEDAVVPTGYDEVWRRANQSLLLMGFTITEHDKEAGVIRATVGEGAQASWFTGCPNGRGLIESYGYSVAILINVLNEESTGIRIAAAGFNTWYQNDHYGLFRTRRLRNYVSCNGTSSGDAEKQVLLYITGGPAPPPKKIEIDAAPRTE